MDLNNETRLQPSKTGPTKFLESPRIDRVPVELKQLVTETYVQTGNFTSACRIVGIDPRNMRLHLNADPEFAKAIAEAREQISDKAEGHIVEHMGRAQNVVDRLAWLRAWRPAVWNPQRESGVTVNVQITEKLAGSALSYIQTSAVPTDRALATDRDTAPPLAGVDSPVKGTATP